MNCTSEDSHRKINLDVPPNCGILSGMVWRNADNNSEVLEDSEVIVLLKDSMRGQTQASFAASINCSTQYLSDVCNGHRKPGTKILDALGLQKKITYKRRWR